jgi:hypothetical protein
VAWMRHLLPSQCSGRVTTTPEPLVKFPTAVQEDELEQETPASWPVRVKRFRVGTIDHPDPGAVAGGISETRARPPVLATFAWADVASAGTARTADAMIASSAERNGAHGNLPA